MEITINIPKNNYVQPTEVRQEVVQHICEAFLDPCCWSTYHPYSDGCYRNATRYVLMRNGKGYGFHDEPFSGDSVISFNGAEMKAAFKVLIDAGYHMFKRYCYGSWLGYTCRKRPFDYDGGKEVFEFTDFID